MDASRRWLEGEVITPFPFMLSISLAIWGEKSWKLTDIFVAKMDKIRNLGNLIKVVDLEKYILRSII